ncbi:MAG: hypothetical protein WCY33_06635, partial [Clostridia bacterium]
TVNCYKSFAEAKAEIAQIPVFVLCCEELLSQEIKMQIREFYEGLIVVCLNERAGENEEILALEYADEVIKENIPSGFNVHKKGQRKFDFSRLRCRANVDINRAMLSIGTLGGGNHFIEIGRGDVSEDVYLVFVRKLIIIKSSII